MSSQLTKGPVDKGWKRVRLGDIYEIGSSKRVLQREWKSSGVPFYRAREVVKLAKHGRVDNELYISEAHFEELKNSRGVPQRGDLMVSAVGTLGACYAVQEKDRFYFKDASVLWLRPKVEVEPRFIQYAFLSTDLLERVKSSDGATVGTFTISRARDTEVSLPNLTEQKRIVAVLDQAFAALDRAHNLVELNLAAVRKLGDQLREAELDSRGKNWTETKVGEICDQFEYGTSSKSMPEGQVPVLRMSNIQNGEIDWRGLKYSSNVDDMEKLSLNEGDILFNRTNSIEHVGKTAIYRGERRAIFAGYLIRLHCRKDQVDPEYLNFFLNSGQAKAHGLAVMGKSINQANISASKLKTYPIALPPIIQQRLIAERIESIRRLTSVLHARFSAKIANIDDLRQSLLQKAFSGELT